MTNPQVYKSYNNLETVLEKDKPAKISGTAITSQSTTSILFQRKAQCDKAKTHGIQNKQLKTKLL